MAFRVKWATAATNVDMYGPTMSVAANGRGIFIERRSGDASTVVIAYRYSGSTFSTVANATGAYGSTANWVHICVTYDGTTIRTYVDGVASGTAASASTFMAAGANDEMSLCGPLNGEVADVCFFSRALSAAEVLQLSAIRQPASLARGDCLGWYPAIETSSLTNAGIDYSGSGNHCTLQNSGSNNPAVGSVSVPKAWGGPSAWQALRIAPVTLAIDGAGSSQTTGAAAVTSSASLTATGTTQCTGTATMTASAAIVASASTQTTGAADVPSGLQTGFSAGSSFAGFTAWVYARSSVAASDVVWCPLNQSSAPIGLLRISLNGTTLRFSATNDSTGSSYAYQQTISFNTWYHVSIQVNSTTIDSYVNGALVDSGSFDRTGVNGYGQLIIGRNADATIRDAIIGSLLSAQVARAYKLRAWQGYGGVYVYYPLLEGGQRLSNFGGFVSLPNSALLVLGSGLAEGSENPPAAFGGTNTLQFLTSTGSIAAAGSTQVTGAAVITSSAPIAASGVTNVSGASAMTESAPLVAVGSVQTSGAATTAESAALVAAGSTQVTGASIGAESAALVASGLTQVSGIASPSGALLATGTTNVTGSASVTLAQTFQISGAGTTNTSGASSLAITYTQTASGSTQTSGVANLDLGPVGGGGAGNQTGADRRWSDLGGMRRKTRR